MTFFNKYKCLKCTCQWYSYNTEIVMHTKARETTVTSSDISQLRSPLEGKKLLPLGANSFF